MEARELRIGNRILCRGEEVVVSMIGKFGVQCEVHGKIINAKFDTPDLESIPLSEERLLKFGFKKELDDVDIDLGCDAPLILRLPDGDHILLFDDGTLCLCDSWRSFEVDLKNMQFIHQLQNIYFALTGEELTLK